ncbi:hypothetical protein PCH_Pc22g22340 [Penicillium rubens Wisconsin 54-1255]|uniref:Uncharacterized protein n=1 Tax=Penicillium rubens (strain ATCC 28089 / DSM 1075 / NRRL 1951 / Wisconsin 54-1255) TaxID=500485 RepID=B6HU71_PENRW|nr:hypothetical protein PCH_Pc22g22340 [Penicillium rubens Wisconsin 54-1255]
MARASNDIIQYPPSGAAEFAICNSNDVACFLSFHGSKLYFMLPRISGMDPAKSIRNKFQSTSDAFSRSGKTLLHPCCTYAYPGGHISGTYLYPSPIGYRKSLPSFHPSARTTPPTAPQCPPLSFLGTSNSKWRETLEA